MTVGDLIDSWVAYSHRMHLKHLLGVAAPAGANLDNLIGSYNNYRRSAATERYFAEAGVPIEGPIAEAGDNDIARLSCGYPGRATVALYSYTTGGGKRWRGLSPTGRITDPMPMPRSGPYEVSVANTMRAFLRDLLSQSGGSLAAASIQTVDDAIERLAARSARLTRPLEHSGDEAKAKELVEVCRKCGCQKMGAAKLLAAYGFPDPTPYIVSSGSHELLSSWTVLKLRKGMPKAPAGTPVMLVAKTPEDSSYWRVADDALRVLPNKVAHAAASFEYCPPDEARAFLRRLADNLTALFSSASEEAAAAQPSTAAA